MHAQTQKEITINYLHQKKEQGKKISMLTGYDHATAGILDECGIEIILVGDSLNMVFAGKQETTSCSLEQIIYHSGAVVRAAKRSFVVADMPFGAYKTNPQEAVANSLRIVKESGAKAVKMEGGEEILESVKSVIDNGISVMGHLGLTPQSVNQIGGYRLVGKQENEARYLFESAKKLEQIGCFSLVLEKVPSELATKVAQTLSIPVIGIGAGAQVDGQVLVVNDMLGITEGFNPKFLRKFGNVGDEIKSAVKKYISSVERNDFPGENESY
jgi:3-methyl-2-oxobutanoate hydroxymethyltransferase